MRTGPLLLPPHLGSFVVMAAGMPDGATELGVVEVHGTQREGAIDVLLPLFVEKAAGLGGDAAIVDAVEARFEIVERPRAETYTYPCGFQGVCTGTRFYDTSEEVMVVRMRGRAMKLAAGDVKRRS